MIKDWLMSNEMNKQGFVYRPETYMRTGVNVSVFGWLALLGIPALLLFLIYSKVDERMNQPAPASAVQVAPAQP